MLKYILAVGLFALLVSSIASAYAIGFDYSLEELVKEKQKDYPSWYTGLNIGPGQSYTFHICDSSIKPTLNYASTCYHAKLDFIALLQEQSSKVWIVQAVFTPDDAHNQWFSILHISQDFATITTDGTSRNYATSLSHTIFYLDKYADMYKPQKLKLGTSWGQADDYVSPIPQFIVNKFTTDTIGNMQVQAYEVGFEVAKANVFYIKEGFPFPIRSVLYDSKSIITDAPPVFSTELLDASNLANGSGQTPDIRSDQIKQNQPVQTEKPQETLPQKVQANVTSDSNYTTPINSTKQSQTTKDLKSFGNWTIN